MHHDYKLHWLQRSRQIETPEQESDDEYVTCSEDDDQLVRREETTGRRLYCVM